MAPLAYALWCSCPAEIIAALIVAGADAKAEASTYEGRHVTAEQLAQKKSKEQLLSDAVQLAAHTLVMMPLRSTVSTDLRRSRLRQKGRLLRRGGPKKRPSARQGKRLTASPG
jgi:hypothetical protein